MTKNERGRLYSIMWDELIAYAAATGRPTTLQAIREATGQSKATLSRLSNGQLNNPSPKLLDALATYFRVDPAFWHYSHERTIKQYFRSLLRARSIDPDEQRMLKLRTQLQLRSALLSSDELEALLEQIDRMAKTE